MRPLHNAFANPQRPRRPGWIGGALLAGLVALGPIHAVEPSRSVSSGPGVAPLDVSCGCGSSSAVPGPPWRVPAEFERQTALLLACRDFLEEAPQLFREVVQKTQGSIDVVVLVTDEEQREIAERVLGGEAESLRGVHFVKMPHDTMWARDYGPLIAQHDQGHPVIIDATYAGEERTLDDQVPRQLGRMLSVPVVRAPFCLDGGNLLSNGDGLALTTEQFLVDNSGRGLGDETLCDTLRRLGGFKEVVILEPLLGESTGHVDMFATFCALDAVVVGEYSPQVDAENAALLDRNAERLRQLHTSKGPLRVVRIPMPPNQDNLFRTYTNVIYANQVLLMPVYPGVDVTGYQKARSTLAGLLPGWRIATIDASPIIGLSGALHCVTMNLGPLAGAAELPQLVGLPPRASAR